MSYRRRESSFNTGFSLTCGIISALLAFAAVWAFSVLFLGGCAIVGCTEIVNDMREKETKKQEKEDQEANWYNVEDASGLTHDDVTVFVEYAIVDFPKYRSVFGINTQTSTEKKLIVGLKFVNENKTKIAELLDTDSTFQLTDNYKNKYSILSNDATIVYEGTTGEHKVYPEKSVERVFIFDPPIENFKYLKLKINAKCMGGDGYFRFKIPKSYVKNP